ncbi:hypothetical protein EGW08_012079, partial [Elysia chlorotica]
ELGLEIHHTFGQFRDHLLLCYNPTRDGKPFHVSGSVNAENSSVGEGRSTSAGISQLHRMHSDLKARDSRLFDLRRQMIESRLVRHPEVVTFSTEHVHRRTSRLAIPPRKEKETVRESSGSSKPRNSSAAGTGLNTDVTEAEPISGVLPHVSSSMKHARRASTELSAGANKVPSSSFHSALNVHSSPVGAGVPSLPLIPKSFHDSPSVFPAASTLHKDHKRNSSVVIPQFSILLLYLSTLGKPLSFMEKKDAAKNNTRDTMSLQYTFLESLLQSLTPKSPKLKVKSGPGVLFSTYQKYDPIPSSLDSPTVSLKEWPSTGQGNSTDRLALPHSETKRSARSTSSVRALKNLERLYSQHTGKAKTGKNHWRSRPESLRFKHVSANSRPHRRRVRSVEQSYPPMAFNDPAYPSQWHLYNRATPGMDINVTGVWRHNITGRGVTVAVVDDGMEWRNPDLAANYNYKGSWDLNDDDPDPSPSYTKVSNHHGTRCAGEIAAVANNNVCGVGVAYGAKVAGVRVLDGVMTDSMEAEAFNKNMHVNAIFSCSWGPDDDGATVDGPHLMAAKAMKFGVDFGRGGFGSIFVVASGNGGENFDNCNYDGYANSIYTVTIGAVDEDGGMPYYAEECASMLGVTFSSGTSNKRDIVTTDWQPSVNAGQEEGGNSGLFDFRGAGSGIGRASAGQRSSGDAPGCTERHTGTSAAAPLAAGMIALMLEARPCLTWRDVQYIVALTARKVDVDVAHWQQNGAGLAHSHKHGFGLLNAWRMVNAARVWRTVPWLTSYSFTGDNGIIGYVAFNLYVAHLVLLHRRVETFSLYSNGIVGYVAFNLYVAHLVLLHRRVETFSLYSSVIIVMIFSRPKDNSSKGFNDWTFTTVRCWGETPTGDWTILVKDLDQQGSREGTLSKFRLTLFGTPMTSEEFGARRQLVEAAMTGEFLGQNYSLHCPPPPRYQSVYAPVSDRILKILILSGIFLLVMAVYESFEYLFCYDDEKKDTREQMRSARHAARMAQEALTDQDCDQSSALLAPQPRDAQSSAQNTAGLEDFSGCVADDDEDDEDDEELFNASETSELLSRNERVRNGGGERLRNLGVRGSRDGTVASSSEVIPLSTFSVLEVERSTHSEQLDDDAAGRRGISNVHKFIKPPSVLRRHEDDRPSETSYLPHPNGDGSLLN